MTAHQAFAAFVVASLVAPGAQAADSAVSSAFRPSSVFVQAGAAEDVTTLVAGATWDWAWQRRLRAATASGYWEASIGRWSSKREGGDETAWVTQLGVTPIIRLQSASPDARWFVEGGIGLNVLAPIYRNGDKRFSTTFNFGDHIAVGHRFGAEGGHEVTLRLQHFSNAGIKHPNPGEDFVQLRYAVQL